MEITYADAIREALSEEMLRNDKVILLGEDIGPYGGAFKVTRGLIDEFHEDRVRDTPISETAIVGAGAGAAIVGFRPVVEIMYMDFLNTAADQVINHVPKMHFMTGGKLEVPLVIRTQYSAGRSTGAQHSQFFPAFLMNTPGIYVAVPSTPYDAKGLLKTAIRGENPVIFIECAALYRTKGEVPEGDYTIEFGKGHVKRDGNDISVFAFSGTVPKALSAAEYLAKEGISAEVVDPRTLVPLDRDLIISSVKKTGRLMTVEDSCKTAGVGAEIASLVMEDALDCLEEPVKRVACPDMPSPFSSPLQEKYLPDVEGIVAAAMHLF